MGSINLPAGAAIGVDTSILIFTVERNLRFESVLAPLWQALESRKVQVIASELVIVETLTGAYAANNPKLIDDYEEFFRHSGVRLIPISAGLLRTAAQLRADAKLKTPDAIHIATARALGCSNFVTRDRDFRRVTGLSITLLDELVST